MKKISFILSFVFISNVFYGQSQSLNYDDLLGGLNTITTAVPFLQIAPDSRAGAMGDLGVATSPDVNSFHWNPAKYAFIEDKVGAAVSYVPWLRALGISDINLGYLTGYYKLNDQETVAAELRYFNLGEIIFTNSNADVIGQYNPHELAIAAAYARKLSDHFSMGLAGRYIYSNLTGGQSAGAVGTVAGQSIAADLSAYYITDLSRTTDLSVGINISNMGDKLSYTKIFDERGADFIPINLRLGYCVGIRLDDYNRISIGVDMNKLLVPTPPIYDKRVTIDSAGVDIANPDYNQIIAGMDPNVAVVSGMIQSFYDAPDGLKEELREINYSTGLEYWYNEQFALRTGYFFEHNTKGGRKFYTLGAGMKYTVFEIDFSYLINANRTEIAAGNNPLANTMRFTLVFDLGAIQEDGF